MKQIVIFILLVGSLSLTGQSIKVDTEFFKKTYTIYTENPIFLSEGNLANFTTSSLYFNNEEGDLHLGQQAAKSTDFGLYTRGLYATGKVHFFGFIDINRNYQYDKKWNLSHAEVMPEGFLPDPHYYAASKASDWNNQRYDIQGGFVFPILQEKWDLAFWGDYNLGEKYRTEYDPRPKITTNMLKLSAQTALYLAPQHKIAISGKYAYQNMENKMSFSDTDSQTPFYYEKYPRWMSGYGTLLNPLSVSTKRNYYQYDYSLSYHYNSLKSKWLLSFDYQNYKTDTYKNANDSEEQDDIIAHLYSDTYSGKLHYLGELPNQQFVRASLSAMRQENYNFLTLQDGKSYASTKQNVLFESNFLQQKEETYQEMGFFVNYNSTEQKDAISRAQIEYTSWETGALFAREFLFPSVIVNPYLRVSYINMKHILNDQNDITSRVILDNDYTSKALKLFYDEVVYFDNALLSKDQYHLLFGANFKKQIASGKKLSWNISSQYQTTFKGQDRFFWSSSITLYY